MIVPIILPGVEVEYSQHSCATVTMPIVTDVVNCDSRSSKLNWDKLNDSERKRYCDLTCEQLSAISVPDAVHCTNVNCSDPVHIEETTHLYTILLGIVVTCTLT